MSACASLCLGSISMFQATCPSVCAGLSTHVVLLEEAEVADDPDPHQQGGGAQQDATHVVRRDALGRKNTCIITETEEMDCTQNRAFLTSGHSKRFTILPNIHPFIHRQRS